MTLTPQHDINYKHKTCHLSIEHIELWSPNTAISWLVETGILGTHWNQSPTAKAQSHPLRGPSFAAGWWYVVPDWRHGPDTCPHLTMWGVAINGGYPNSWMVMDGL